MRQFIISMLIGLMVFGLAVDTANAARFGGGRSMGTYSRSATPHYQTQHRPVQSGAKAPASGHGRFLTGLVAGGLLGALFFGGGFHGFNLLDFLLIIVIAFVVIAFIAKRRAATAHASANQQYRNNVNQQSASGFNTMNTGGAHQPVPAWFDRERFLNDAKQHFTRIQKAWDDNNLPEIQDYVTPALYNVLRQERANQPANNKTDIVRLFADLASIQELGQSAEASVLFRGTLIENGQQTEFNEVWHLTRSMQDQAPWYIQGIEQRS